MAMTLGPRRERHRWRLFHLLLLVEVFLGILVGLYLGLTGHPIVGWLVSWFR